MTSPSATAPLRWKLALAGGSLLASLLLGEVGVRVYDVFHGGSFFQGPRNIVAQEIAPVRPFRTFGFEPYGSQGDSVWIVSRHREPFPLEKPPGAIRIVCFGGSTTENGVVFRKTGKHYPKRLGELLRERTGLNVEVINVGNSAYCTAHSLIMLELNVLSWSPDVVILSHNLNDLLVAYWPAFRPDYSSKYQHEYYSVPDYRKRFSPANVIFQRFELYWFIKNRIEESRQKDRYAIRRRSCGPEPDPRFVAAFARNLRSFTTLAHANGITVVLGTQPLEPTEEYFNLHMSTKPYNDLVTYPLQAEFVRHHDLMNRTVAEVAAATGSTLVDPAAAMSGRREYFIDLVHYTPEGVERLAEIYADAVMPLLAERAARGSASDSSPRSLLPSSGNRRGHAIG